MPLCASYGIFFPQERVGTVSCVHSTVDTEHDSVALAHCLPVASPQPHRWRFHVGWWCWWRLEAIGSIFSMMRVVNGPSDRGPILSDQSDVRFRQLVKSELSDRDTVFHVDLHSGYWDHYEERLCSFVLTQTVWTLGSLRFAIRCCWPHDSRFTLSYATVKLC